MIPSDALRPGGEAIDVPMYRQAFISFKHEYQQIGAQGLGGCSVVAIVSSRGAILAHIPPGDDDSTIQQMQRVHRLYRRHKDVMYDAYAFIITGLQDGEPGLRDIEETIQTYLYHRMRLQYDITGYEVLWPDHPQRCRNGQGTVLVDGRGRHPKLYVEHRELLRDSI